MSSFGFYRKQLLFKHANDTADTETFCNSVWSVQIYGFDKLFYYTLSIWTTKEESVSCGHENVIECPLHYPQVSEIVQIVSHIPTTPTLRVYVGDFIFE